MQIFGVNSKTIDFQDLKEALKGLSISYLGDCVSSDVIIIDNIELYREKAFYHNKQQCQYKYIIFYGFKDELLLIDNLFFVEHLDELILDDTTEFGDLHVRIKNHTLIENAIDNIGEPTFFTKIFLPLLKLNSKNRKIKKLLMKAIVDDIKSLVVISSTEFKISSFKDEITKKHYKIIIEWLRSEEAKELSEVLVYGKDSNRFNEFDLNFIFATASKSLDDRLTCE